VPGQPKGLTVEPAAPVAHRRLANLARHRQTQAQIGKSIFTGIDDQPAVADGSASVIDATEIGWPTQVLVRTEAVGSSGGHDGLIIYSTASFRADSAGLVGKTPP